MIRRVPAIAAAAAVLAGCAREAVPPAPVFFPPPRIVVAPSPPRPAWLAHRVVTDAVAVPGGRLHTVKSGETGIAIAHAYGVPWSKIVAANRLRPPFTIEIGDKLLLPSAKQVAAQSVEERAKAFRIDIDDLITGAEPAGGGPAAAKAAGTSVAVRPKPGGRPPAVASAAGVAKPRIATAEPGAARPVRNPPERAATTAPRPATAAALPLLPALPASAPVFAWPVEGRILSGFGAKPGGRYNDGVNLKASPGTAVRAAADGVVAYAGDAVAGFGNLILIQHADGWVSAYGHNEALLVARGARVARGDIIARSGATGAVDEPQLHFELRRGRVATDPVKLLPARG